MFLFFSFFSSFLLLFVVSRFFLLFSVEAPNEDFFRLIFSWYILINQWEYICMYDILFCSFFNYLLWIDQNNVVRYTTSITLTRCMRAVCCEANDTQIFCVFSLSLPSRVLSLLRERKEKNEEKKEKERARARKRERDELVRRAKNGANRFFLQTERPIIEQQVVCEKTSGTVTAYTHIHTHIYIHNI